MNMINHKPESILSAASKHSEKNRSLYPVKYCKMQCIINELKKKSCLVTAEVMKLGFPHTPPQYFQLFLIFPTHHMLCTLISPPLPELLFSWAEQEWAFVCSDAELKLCSSAGWMLPSRCQGRPGSALHLPHWPREEMASTAPPAPRKFCYNHSVLLRPLQGWVKSAAEVPEKHN